jgi:signal transduction histidine kinase
MISTSEYFIIFFESVAFFMALFFFIQYSILKKPEYLFYALYLLLLFIYYLLAIPELFFGITFTDEENLATFNLYKRPVQFVISIFYSLFVMHYLRLKDRSRPLHFIFRVLLVLYLVLALGCLVGNIFKVHYDTFYYVFGLMLFPIQLYVVTALFKYKVPYSIYIIWGSIILLIGSSVTLTLSLLRANNEASGFTNATTYIPVMICILVDIFLFTVALQRKIADNENSLINAALSRQHAVMLERERIIADLHDDVGGGLSSIRMMSDLLSNQEGENNQDNRVNFPRKISATAKEIALRMNTIIWSLNVENDTLQNFSEYVRLFGISFFENSPMKFGYYNTAPDAAVIELTGVQRKNLFLIIKESLHNTLKHSGASYANVIIHLDKGWLLITMEDNGKGFQHLNGMGNGLKNMKRRAAEINGAIEFEAGQGTTIQVSVRLR